MGFGRMNWHEPPILLGTISFGLFLSFGSEMLSSYVSLENLFQHTTVDLEAVYPLLDMTAWLAMPLWVLSATGTAMITLAVCMLAAENFKSQKWLVFCTAMGRMSMTVYVLNVTVSLCVFNKIGIDFENRSPSFVMGMSGGFFIFAMAFSALWERKFRRGPLERMMRGTKVFWIKLPAALQINSASIDISEQ